MDGVLVLSEPFIAAAAMAMFAEKGFTVRAEEFRPFIGAGEDRFIGGVAAARGIPIEPERDKARTYAIYLEKIRGHLQPLPGAKEFVEQCAGRGLKLAIASGSDTIKVEANEACARLRLEPAVPRDRGRGQRRARREGSGHAMPRAHDVVLPRRSPRGGLDRA